MTFLDRVDNFVASAGVEAYRVGGSVRDEVLGRRCKDADYVVRGVDLPELGNVFKTLPGVKSVTALKLRDGRKVGIRVHKPGLGLIEIVLPRTERKMEVEGGNERHNFEIIADPNLSLHEDAVRRDFTFNALYSPTGKLSDLGDLRAVGGLHDPVVVDPLGTGLDDLRNGVIRTTHPDSFRDDPLRILRAIRFVSVLGFDLADETLGQMVRHSNAVTGLTGKGVSATALDELCKILMGRHVGKAMRIMRDTGVMAVFLPELAPMIGHDQQNSHHNFSTDEHTFVALEAAAALNLSLRVRMALLFHDSGKPEVEWVGDDGFKHYFEAKNQPGSEDHQVASARRVRAALKRLNAERALLRDVPILVENHMVPLSMKVKVTKVRKWRCDLGDEMLADLLKHRLCDVMGKGVVDYEALRAIERMEKIREEAVKMGIPVKPSDMPISGHDLIAIGVEGEAIGRILKQLLHEVISDPVRNDREWLLGRAAVLASKT